MLFWYQLNLGLVKISILTFYLRLFSSLERVIYVFLTFVVSLTVVSCVSEILQCTPVRLYWAIADTSLSSRGHCVNKAVLQYVLGGLNLVTDIMILILPIKPLLSMHLKTGLRHMIITSEQRFKSHKERKSNS